MSGLYGYQGILPDFPRGVTVPLTFNWATAAGVAIDVTGYKVYVAISSDEGESNPDLEVILEPTDAENGVISGDITDTETLALTAGEYFYSIKYIKPDGKAFPIDMGKVDVHEAVNPRIAQ